MKKIFIISGQALLVILLSIQNIETFGNQTVTDKDIRIDNESEFIDYKFPNFYKGIYLNIYTAKDISKLSDFAERAKEANINSMVLDIHYPEETECVLPPENIEFCKENLLHPIARIVVFTNGLKEYPVPDEVLDQKIRLAEEACKIGFMEIQFDYIRFNDHRVIKRLSLKERYDFIEGFLKKAGIKLKKYGVKIAADVFGRIPLNRSDIIGQRMEGLDEVVDIICPMAYPSHYTWSRKFMSNPYYTVFLTSKSAKERTSKAEIVTYIQAFKMKISMSRLSFHEYIEAQLKAVHDSGVKGYILWNASQKYDVPFEVLKDFYEIDHKRAEL